MFPVLQLFGSFLPLVVFRIAYLVLKFAILSIDVDHLVDDVLVGSVEISRNHGQSFTEMLADSQGDTRSGHIFLQPTICGTVQYNIIKPRSSNMTGAYATASGRVASSSKCCSGYMLSSFLVAASVASCGASWPTSAAG